MVYGGGPENRSRLSGERGFESLPLRHYMKENIFNMPTQREIIIKQVLEILQDRPNGIRYSELVKEIKSKLVDIPENTIHGIK